MFMFTFVDVVIQSSTFQRKKRENGDKIGKIKRRQTSADKWGLAMEVSEFRKTFGTVRDGPEVNGNVPL